MMLEFKEGSKAEAHRQTHCNSKCTSARGYPRARGATCYTAPAPLKSRSGLWQCVSQVAERLGSVCGSARALRVSAASRMGHADKRKGILAIINHKGIALLSQSCAVNQM